MDAVAGEVEVEVEAEVRRFVESVGVVSWTCQLNREMFSCLGTTGGLYFRLGVQVFSEVGCARLGAAGDVVEVVPRPGQLNLRRFSYIGATGGLHFREDVQAVWRRSWSSDGPARRRVRDGRRAVVIATGYV